MRGDTTVGWWLTSDTYRVTPPPQFAGRFTGTAGGFFFVSLVTILTGGATDDLLRNGCVGILCILDNLRRIGGTRDDYTAHAQCSHLPAIR
jgi:hypothetical protein